MPKPSHHIFICTNQRPAGHPRGSCGENNAMALMERMGIAVETKGLFGQVLVTNASCIGPCSMGPVMVVYPDGAWQNKALEDVEEILDQHIGQGKKSTDQKCPKNFGGNEDYTLEGKRKINFLKVKYFDLVFFSFLMESLSSCSLLFAQ